MRKLALLLALAVSAVAQFTPGSPIVFVTNAPSGACTNGVQLRLRVSTGILYSCQGGTWGSFGVGSGSVTSVGLTLPSIFTVTVSPITGSGSLTATLATQSANLVWAGPTTGVAATPTFRSLVAADLPAGTGTVTSVGLAGTANQITVTGSSPITSSGSWTLSLPAAVYINASAQIGDFLVGSTSSSTGRGIVAGQWSSDTSSARFSGYKARGTQASPTIVTTGDFTSRWSGFAYDGSNYLECASIVTSTVGTVAVTRTPGQIDFQTCTDAAPSVLTTRMTILPNGNVGIGVTPSLRFDVDGNFQVDAVGAIRFAPIADSTVPSTYSFIKNYSSGNLVVGTAASKSMYFNVGTPTYLSLNSGDYGVSIDYSGSAGTLRVFDSTATTGVTKGFFREGAGQSTNEVFGIYANNGTTPRLSLANNILTVTSQLFAHAPGAASTPGAIVDGAFFTGGSGTTTMPQFLIRPAGTTAATTWSTAGTALGVNAPSGFTGNFIDLHLSGGTSLFSVDYTGQILPAGGYKSADGTAGVTVTTCTGYKNGLCISGT